MVSPLATIANAPRQQIDPGADAHLLALAHHLERLVQQRLARHLAVDDLDVPIRQRESSSRGISHDRYPMSQRELEHDAACSVSVVHRMCTHLEESTRSSRSRRLRGQTRCQRSDGQR